jgi:hypothetical protein
MEIENAMTFLGFYLAKRFLYLLLEEGDMRERSEGSIGFFLVVVPWSGRFLVYDFIQGLHLF